MVPMILVMGTIFFLSHHSGEELHLPSFPGADKIAHFIAYAVLAVTVIFAHKRQSWFEDTRRVCLTTVFVTFCYGISDEFHQSFIPNRYSSVGDIIADTLGGVVVACLFLYLVKRVKK